ncbi:hypothetical protein J41TS12_05990 [Paenibacillus antibioticophila]|uniref:Uncharacterized protein n=1 Tax=Paenibacillus antibioticophila TaxID=1274374 RepID=A0A919XQL5_9BACL|nr:hypothetical protein [Paenibacillus antibioticophila]GIO35738.1 hypothetical protein J41TS12_05990 [Paenibacillus antibioticophila]
MKKQNDPLDEKTSKEWSNLFMDLFGDSDPFAEFKRKYKPFPLKKKGNIRI